MVMHFYLYTLENTIELVRTNGKIHNKIKLNFQLRTNEIRSPPMIHKIDETNMRNSRPIPISIFRILLSQNTMVIMTKNNKKT